MAAEVIVLLKATPVWSTNVKASGVVSGAAVIVPVILPYCCTIVPSLTVLSVKKLAV